MSYEKQDGEGQTMPERSRAITSQHGSPAAIGMALFAMAVFFITGGGSWILPLCMLALIWTHFIPARFPRQSFAPWIVRLMAFGFIGLSGVGKPASGAGPLFMDARTVNLLGLICAAELTLQFWRPCAPDRFPRSSLLLSGLIFLSAANTADDRYIRFFTPAFILLTLLALRDLSKTRPLPEATLRSPLRAPLRPKFTRHTLGNAVLIALALACGAGIHSIIDSYRDQLTSLGSRYFYEQQLPQAAGISDQPRLGSRFISLGSTQRIMRVEGTLQDQHLRTASFDEYEAGTWGPALSNRKTVPLPDTPTTKPHPHWSQAHITRLVDNEKHYIFAPLNTAAIIPNEGSTIEWNAEQGGPLKCDDVTPYEYTIQETDQSIEGVPIYQGPLCAPITSEQRQRCLQLPPDLNPRVREMAQDITKSTTHPAERAEAIVEYLLSHYSYSLRARRGGGDPVTNFLLDRRSAHCEYFGSAAAILLRCVGVPSRYVVGYLAHEGDGPNGYIVRQRDAHAWTEAWIEDVGWVTLDATPGDGRPDHLPPLPWWQHSWEKFGDKFAQLREQMANLSREQWGMVLAALVILWGLTRWRMARRKTTPTEEETIYAIPAVQLAEAAARFENWMTREGLHCPGDLSWRQYLSHLETPPDDITLEHPLNPHHVEAAQDFVHEYERVRWGHPEDIHAVENVIELLNRLEQTQAPERTHR